MVRADLKKKKEEEETVWSPEQNICKAKKDILFKNLSHYIHTALAFLPFPAALSQAL